MESVRNSAASLRRSRQRQEVMRVLRGTTSHPTADWIYQEVKRSIPSVSLGTIYRNLRILREAGNILELNFGDSISRFDGRTDDHYHFLCEKCGCILDVEKSERIDLSSVYPRQAGITVHTCRLELLGICADCGTATPDFLEPALAASLI